MSARIDYRIEDQGGRRYAVLPLEQFTDLVERAGNADDLTIPHEVASRHLVEEISLVRAWREYLGLTQARLAERLGVTQGQVAQWEAPDARPRRASLKRIASALGLYVGQLTLADEPTRDRMDR